MRGLGGGGCSRLGADAPEAADEEPADPAAGGEAPTLPPSPPGPTLAKAGRGVTTAEAEPWTSSELSPASMAMDVTSAEKVSEH